MEVNRDRSTDPVTTWRQPPSCSPPRVTYCSAGTYKPNALLRGLHREEGAKCQDVFGEQTLLLQLTSLAIPAAALETHTVLLVPWKLFRLLPPPLSLVPSPELRSCPTLALTQCWAYNSEGLYPSPNSLQGWGTSRQTDMNHIPMETALYFGISKKKKKNCFFRTPTLPSPAQSLLPHIPFSTEQHDTLLHTCTLTQVFCHQLTNGLISHLIRWSCFVFGWKQ